MLAFEIVEKFRDRFDEQADPSQVPHIGFDMNGVHTLLFQVNLESLGQCPQGGIENLVINAIGSQFVTHGPEGFMADV